MRTSDRPNSGNNRRQRWLTAYRVISVVISLVILAVVIFVRPTQTVVPTYTATQATKVERAAAFLQDVGFNNPLYLGITPGSEGEYPTFRVVAIGGKSIDLWIRTTSNGGWEIQPCALVETIASADDLARRAQAAVLEWKHMPQDIKPRTDGNFGEYESRRYQYEALKDYVPSGEYWSQPRNETRDWPRK